ncbi:hypothetical protein SRHO_G00236770 [Serrasalmus rhombeus]
MFQGSEASLSSVQQDFSFIKALAETGKKNEKNSSSSAPQGSGEGRGGQTHSSESGSAQDSSAQDNSAQYTHLHNTVFQLRKSLSLHEVELVELKQMLLSNPPENDPSQQLKHQLDLLQNSLLDLKRQMQELQQDRESLRKELIAVREETQIRDKTLNDLKEELRNLKTSQLPSEQRPAHSDPQPTHPDPQTAHPEQGPALSGQGPAHSDPQPTPPAHCFLRRAALYCKPKIPKAIHHNFKDQSLKASGVSSTGVSSSFIPFVYTARP